MYLTFDVEQTEYPICLLSTSLRKDSIENEYIKPFGIEPKEIVALSLHQKVGVKKTPVKEIKQYIVDELVPTLTGLKTKYILVTDSEYFKVLTKQPKAEANLGYVMSCAYGPWEVIYVPSFQQIFYNPEAVRAKIAQAMQALLDHRKGSYAAPGISITHYADYPRTYEEIKKCLLRLYEMQKPLSCDLEGFGLKHYDCGIGTISFAWSKHEGVAFPVDLGPEGKLVRDLLKDFFTNFKPKIIYHNIAFDAYVLIYQLFMKDILDTEGLLEGLEIMLRNWDCTKQITFLATNSCAGNHLGLKDQSQEFSGNYSMGDDIKDITKIPLDKLLEYNLVDSLSTWYVHEKHWPTVVMDQQLDIYNTIFKPAMVDIIQMQLTGMPVNMKRAKEVDGILQKEIELARIQIMQSPIIKAFTSQYLDVKYAEKKNAEWVKKRITPAEAHQEFNPNSDDQKRALFFDYLKLPTINLTDSKLPSTDGETVEALINHVDDPEVKQLLEAFRLYNIINILTTNFMPAILGSIQGPDGWHYLFGNFNLGGTLSGRLSSSGPNMQNLPSTGKGHAMKLKYAKLIKSCFQAPPGWLFVGIDFSSLEDRISALTTKDPLKLSVYTDGFDGHSLRAQAYFPDKMPDIEFVKEDIPCYKANVGTTEIYFHANERIEYLGKNMTGKELYDLLTNQKL